MPDWFVSSTAYAALPQFVVSGVYTVGNIIRPLTAPGFAAQYAFRCTTAGTASTEPGWAGSAPNNGQTVTTGGATFTNVSGQSTYGWGAAAGNLACLTSAMGAGSNRFVVGDRVYVSSDHNETSNSGTFYALTTSAGYGVIQVLSVNRAGSVPPVAADLTAGAVIENTGTSFGIDNYVSQYWNGVVFKATGGGGNCTIHIGGNNCKQNYFAGCQFWLNNANAGSVINSSLGCKAVFDNTTIRFGAVGQTINTGGSVPFEILWINSPTPIHASGSVPTVLFTGGNQVAHLATFRGVDLSLLNTTLFAPAGSQASVNKFLLDSCRIASGLVPYSTPTNAGGDEVELVNCYNGTSFVSERHTPAGDVTTEFTITLTGGATDNVGTFSHKMVTSARSDKFTMPLEGFWMDANYATTGASKTATVEIVSSASLNNDEITLLLEYEGTASSSLASFVSSFPNPLTTPSSVTASTATWNSLPATPVKQHVQVTFTPRTAGRVRAQVRLGKPSTTVYVNPQITIS